MPAHTDTLGKIIGYFEMVTKYPFEYKGTVYTPKPLRVSPDIARGYTCPAGCGGCCPRFSLDYLPTEERPDGCTPRDVEFNGTTVTIFSDMQNDNYSYHCKHLNLYNGRCTIHTHNPFSCDFELIRFAKFSDPSHPNQVTTRLFGRGWQLLKIDGQRGAACAMLPITDESRADTIRKLRRLDDWARAFNLETKIDAIITWLETNPDVPLVI